MHRHCADVYLGIYLVFFNYGLDIMTLVSIMYATKINFTNSSLMCSQDNIFSGSED